MKCNVHQQSVLLSVYCDTSYIIQRINTHPTLNTNWRFIKVCTCRHNDKTIPLNIGKSSEINKIFIENSEYFFIAPPCMCFFCSSRLNTIKMTNFAIEMFEIKNGTNPRHCFRYLFWKFIQSLKLQELCLYYYA